MTILSVALPSERGNAAQCGRHGRAFPNPRRAATSRKDQGPSGKAPSDPAFCHEPRVQSGGGSGGVVVSQVFAYWSVAGAS